MHQAITRFSKTILPRNLARTRQRIRPQPSGQSVPLACHISNDALLRYREEYGRIEYGGLPVFGLVRLVRSYNRTRLIDVEQKVVTSTEAKATLNALLADLPRTGAVVITSRGEPVAVLSPFVDAPRRFGQLPTLTVPDDFDAPLPDSELAAWEQDS